MKQLSSRKLKWHLNQSSRNLKRKENSSTFCFPSLPLPLPNHLITLENKVRTKDGGFRFNLLWEELVLLLHCVTWRDGSQMPLRQHYLDANHGWRNPIFSFLRKPLVTKWQYPYIRDTQVLSDVFSHLNHTTVRFQGWRMMKPKIPLSDKENNSTPKSDGLSILEPLLCLTSLLLLNEYLS